MLRSRLLLAWFLIAAVLVSLPLGFAEGPVGDKVALLVGVTAYQGGKLEALEYAGRDAVEMAALLKQSGYTRVVLLTSTSTDEKLRPTGENIRRELAELLKKRTKRDIVLVGLSGHGVQPDGENDSFFCPSDANLADLKTLLSLSKLYEQLDDSGAGVKLLLVDACRNDPAAKGSKGVDGDNLPKVSRGMAALFSCSPREKSFEHKSWQHGAFFYTVLEGLKPGPNGRLAADTDGTGEVDFDKLSRYVRKTVPKRVAAVLPGAEQNPNVVSDLTALVPLVHLEGSSKAGPTPTPTPKPMIDTKPGSVPVYIAEPKELVAKTVDLKLKWIQPGRFQMGSPGTDPDAYDTEKPQHEVQITRPFYLGVYEVTVGQFETFVKATGHRTTDESEQRGLGFDVTTGHLEQRRGFSWRNPGFGQGRDHPVVSVSWTDATAFCKWLADREHRPYRLPTEAEWEYACRAGRTTRYFTGDDADSVRKHANLGDASLRAKYRETMSSVRWDDGHPFTSPGGTFEANPWGLHDMYGNAWEWCGDFGRNYAKESVPDPVGKGPGKYVLRGGSCLLGTSYCRSALRNRVEQPTFRAPDTGFRVAMTAVAP